MFDNDDPQGRAFLNLFVSHPMIQALQSTQWEPTFSSAESRIAKGTAEFERAGVKWSRASDAVAAADLARNAAIAAEAATKACLAATASIDKARKNLSPSVESTVSAFREAVKQCMETANRAEGLTSDANTAAEAARNAVKPAAASARDARSPRIEPLSQSEIPVIAESASTVVALPSGKSEKAATLAGAAIATLPEKVDDLLVLADAASKRANIVAKSANMAAADARKAATSAEKAKRGLYSELIQLVDVPKYIPDSTFADVLVHVLTDDATLRVITGDEANAELSSTESHEERATFWQRFETALGIVRGASSRLTDAVERQRITTCIDGIVQSVSAAGQNVAAGEAILGELEKGMNQLRSEIAAISDAEIRTTLEREIETSLRPLHALGRDILMLQRAGQALARMADSAIKTAISAFLAEAGEDLSSFKKRVGSWYNSVMDHASGWYKRNTQIILAQIALILCVINNVDTVSLVKHLSTDPQLRATAAKEAQAFRDTSQANQKPTATSLTETPPQATRTANGSDEAESYKATLIRTGLPLWWSQEEWNRIWYSGKASAFRFSPTLALSKFVGLLLSVLAVSMGAPFWFDLLNKFVNVRLGGKRPEPSVGNIPGSPLALPPTDV